MILPKEVGASGSCCTTISNSCTAAGAAVSGDSTLLVQIICSISMWPSSFQPGWITTCIGGNAIVVGWWRGGMLLLVVVDAGWSNVVLGGGSTVLARRRVNVDPCCNCFSGTDCQIRFQACRCCVDLTTAAAPTTMLSVDTNGRSRRRWRIICLWNVVVVGSI